MAETNPKTPAAGTTPPANPTTPPKANTATTPPAKQASGRFKVLFSGAGPFRRDDVVSQKEIAEAGYLTDHWLKIKAIEPTDEPLRKHSDAQDDEAQA